MNESREQMRERLAAGMEYDMSGFTGWIVVGTLNAPHETATKTAPLPEEQIKVIEADVAEIRALLFCRLLLSHPKLFPLAHKADSITEFLANKEITLTDLRDVCLRLEQPTLQEIRDACADLGRADESEEDDAESGDWPKEYAERPQHSKTFEEKDPLLPKAWLSQREKWIQQEQAERSPRSKRPNKASDQEGQFINFGRVEDESRLPTRKVRVRVCGRSIFNWPSEIAISRSGWLQFSIIAKDSSLYDAIELCRHWKEFYELNVLSLWGFFPNPKWPVWGGDRRKQQLLEMGFIPYFQFDQAHENTVEETVGGRAGGKAHRIVHFRNFICAQIRRSDPASRRLIQYLSMLQLHVLVRDAKTGRVVLKPDKDDLWLVRSKAGRGRVSRSEWSVSKSVDREFLEFVHKNRQWNFSFSDYYDVVIWDHIPGRNWTSVYPQLYACILKAHQVRDAPDLRKVAAPVLKTVTRDEKTGQLRELKPNDTARSVFDKMISEDTQFVCYNAEGEEIANNKAIEGYWWSKADQLESEILFPESAGDAEVRTYANQMAFFESREGFHSQLERFTHDLQSDEELTDCDSSDSLALTDGQITSTETEGGESAEDYESDGSVTPDEFLFDNDEDEQMVITLISTPGDEVDQRHGMATIDAIRFSQSMKGKDATPEELSKCSEIKDILFNNLSYWRPQELDMDAQFMLFVDREKSHVFKNSWHAANLEPNAQPQDEVARFLHFVLEHAMQRNVDEKLRVAQMYKWSDPDPFTHKRVLWDFYAAYVWIHMLLPDKQKQYLPNLATIEDEGPLFEGFLPKFANIDERARQFPELRSHQGTTNRPVEHFRALDEVLQADGHVLDNIPVEWDEITRPKIAQMYKAGVLNTVKDSVREGIVGQAFAAPDPRIGQMEFFVDYREVVPTCTLPPDYTDASDIDLLGAAREHAAKRPDARFALLRVWTAAHFYPLMYGKDNRKWQRYMDAVGRIYEWKFIPKDMQYSEHSIHRTVSLRLDADTPIHGRRNLLNKREIILVMGENEDDLVRRAVGATYAIVTRPWRLELDVWKSFVNVDLAYLEAMDKRWFD